MGQLTNISTMDKKSRAFIRTLQPSTWQFEGLQVPGTGKWFQFFVKHSDLVQWAGGLEGVQAKCGTAEEAERYLWSIYEWQVRFIYFYFQEVVDARLLSRLWDWCNEHFTQDN